MRNKFLGKWYTKCGKETIPRSFSKKSKLVIKISVSKVKFIQFIFIVYQVEYYRNILKLSYRPLSFTSCKAFKKTKRGLELISLPLFLYVFWRKIFILLYSIAWPNFIIWLVLLREILGNMCIVIKNIISGI